MKERIVRAVAGTFVLTGVLLSGLLDKNWIWLSVFAGANLLQSSVTKFCPLTLFLDAIGVEKKIIKNK